ncbi:MAG: hypothetical protein ACOVOR_05315, partial [Rhabdochlamydiaceae bacterium]
TKILEENLNSLTQQQTDLKKLITPLEKKLKTINAQTIVKSSQLEKLEKDLKEQESLNLQTENRTKALHQSLSRLEETKSDLQKGIEESQRELEHKETQLKIVQKVLDEQEQTYLQGKKENEQLQKSLMNLYKEKTILDQQVAQSGSELVSIDKKIETKNAQLRLLEASLAKTKNIRSLKHRIKKANTEDARLSFERLRKSIFNAQDIDDSQEILNFQDRNITNLTNVTDHLDEQNEQESFENELILSQEDLGDLPEEARALFERLSAQSSLQPDPKSSDSRSAELEEKLSITEKNLQNEQNTILELRSEITNLKQRIRDIQSEALNQDQDLLIVNRTLKQQIEDIKDQKNEKLELITDRYIITKQENNNLTERVAQLLNENAVLQKHLYGRDSDIEKSQKMIEDLKTKEIHLKENLNEIKNTTPKKEALIIKLNSQLDNSEKDLANLNIEYLELNKKYLEKQDLNFNLEKKLNDSMQQIKDLKTDLNLTQIEKQQMEEAFLRNIRDLSHKKKESEEQFSLERRDLIQEKESIENEYEEMKVRLNKLKAEHRLSSNKIGLLNQNEQETKELQQRYDALKQDYEDIQTKYAISENQELVEQTQIALQKAYQKIDELNEQNEEIKNKYEISQNKELFDKVETELQNAYQTIDELEKEIKILKIRNQYETTSSSEEEL